MPIVSIQPAQNVERPYRNLEGENTFVPHSRLGITGGLFSPVISFRQNFSRLLKCNLISEGLGDLLSKFCDLAPNFWSFQKQSLPESPRAANEQFLLQKKKKTVLGAILEKVWGH